MFLMKFGALLIEYLILVCCILRKTTILGHELQKFIRKGDGMDKITQFNIYACLSK